jgi:hypothetical protein
MEAVFSAAIQKIVKEFNKLNRRKIGLLKTKDLQDWHGFCEY